MQIQVELYRKQLPLEMYFLCSIFTAQTWPFNLTNHLEAQFFTLKFFYFDKNVHAGLVYNCTLYPKIGVHSLTLKIASVKLSLLSTKFKYKGMEVTQPWWRVIKHSYVDRVPSFHY